MARAGSVKRVCLAYSGGLDTSVILHWLIERYGCEVVAYTADIGQEEELSGLPEKARATGAVERGVRRRAGSSALRPRQQCRKMPGSAPVPPAAALSG